jgi:hypothetical protein
MVVILSKDSLYADRMGGIVMIGEIISNLFKEVDKNTLAGINLFFNKFTKDEI